MSTIWITDSYCKGSKWKVSFDVTDYGSEITPPCGWSNWTQFTFIINQTGTHTLRLYMSEPGTDGNSGSVKLDDFVMTDYAAVAPTVTTSGISAVTDNSAAGGGNITDDGGASVTARGVCWSTSVNPTTADSYTSNGTGIFTSYLSGLSPNTTYYVRAYATNSVSTSYGNNRIFRTMETSFSGTGVEVDIALSSMSNGSDALGVLKSGTGNSAVTGETFPDGITKRSDLIWALSEIGTVTADVVFHYEGIFGVQNASSLKLIKRANVDSAWDDVTSSFTNNTGTKTFSANGLTDFSQYSPASTGDNSLPVELSSFTASSDKDKIILKWITESEVENLGFILERSEDNTAYWLEIASYQTHEVLRGQGNTACRTEYKFIDNRVESGKSYYYRLSDISIKGKLTVHSPLYITFESKK